MKKYKNITELYNAVKSGEINEEDLTIVLDMIMIILAGMLMNHMMKKKLIMM